MNIPIQGTFQITPTSKITHQQLSAMHPSTPRNIKHWISKAQNHLKAGLFGCTSYNQTIKLESCLLAAVAWYKSAAYQPSHSSGIFVRQQCLNLAPGNVMGGVAGVPNTWCQSPKLKPPSSTELLKLQSKKEKIPSFCTGIFLSQCFMLRLQPHCPTISNRLGQTSEKHSLAFSSKH